MSKWILKTNFILKNVTNFFINFFLTGAARPFTSSVGDFDNNDLFLFPESDSYDSFQKRADPFSTDDIPGILRFGKRSQSFIR